MLTVFVFVMNVFSLPGVILICCSEFYFAVTVVGHRRYCYRSKRNELFQQDAYLIRSYI